MKKFLAAFFVFGSSALISFCKKSTTAAAATCDSAVTYTATVKSIVDANCTSSGCHNAGSPNGAFINYAGIKPYLSNGTFKNEVVTKKTMPENGKLSSADLNNIQCWLDAGYPEN